MTQITTSTAQKIAFLFPGQGAQYVGMAKEFFDQFAIARETFEEGDEILKRKLSDLIFNGPLDKLTETINSQPAIFLASIATLRVLKQQFPSLLPSVTAGLSLGEYSALAAAGILPFEEALQLVDARARAMNDACEEEKGGMAVIMGMEHDTVEEMVDQLRNEQGLSNDLWSANFNCPGQVVISGTVKGIEKGGEEATKRGARRVVPLQVHGAFHSGLMQKAEERLKAKILSSPFVKSTVSLVMNVPGNFVEGITNIRENLIQQLTNPVRWERGIRAINQEGLSFYLEIGCGKTLTGMNKRIGVTAPSLNVDRVADMEKLDKQLQEAAV